MIILDVMALLVISRADRSRSRLPVLGVILAAVMVPFMLAALYFAFSSKFDRHKKIVRGIWPVWMFVSVSGIAVNLMLYVF